MLAIVMPAENGCRKQKSMVESWLGLRSVISNEGTMYHGKLIKRLTPISSDPHIRMKTKRKTELPLDRPPRDRFFVNILENQRAAATASIAFITEAKSIARTAKGDAV